jgi:Rieske 2Fe-2S family protein
MQPVDQQETAMTTVGLPQSLISTLPGQLLHRPGDLRAGAERIFERCGSAPCALERPADARRLQDRPGGPGERAVVRGATAQLRAFLNVCRHRGAQLCTEESGEVKRAFQCPYHAWTYDLDGKLVAAPNLTKMPDIDRVEYGLVPVHLREWLGYAWVCLADEPPSFEDDVVGAVTERLGDVESIEHYELDSLRSAAASPTT